METASLLWPHRSELKRMWKAYEIKKKKKKTSNQKDFLFIFPNSALGGGLKGEQTAAKAKS